LAFRTTVPAVHQENTPSANPFGAIPLLNFSVEIELDGVRILIGITS